MLSGISLTVLLAVAAPPQDPAAEARAAGVESVLGEEVLAVAHIDLMKADVSAFVRRVVGKLADEEEVRGTIGVVGAWTEALKKAGARDLFVLLDPDAVPGTPIVVVPVTGGADSKDIAAVPR